MKLGLVWERWNYFTKLQLILFQISYIISKESVEAEKAAKATTTMSIKAGAGAAASVVPVLNQ